MSRYHSYLNSAEAIISTYNGDEPLALFLKKTFAANKKFGSKDRKQVTHLCYCYFRLGKVDITTSLQDRLLIGLFLCSNQPSEMLQALHPGWNNKVGLCLEEKQSIIHHSFLITDIFPWHTEWSSGIDKVAFNKFHLVQPLLFLRVRPGYENVVKQKLTQHSIGYQLLGDSCIALHNNTKLDGIIKLDKEAVVQDYSSQRVGQLLLLIKSKLDKPIKVWDCCAASGGKSILATDMLGQLDLTVSDVRQSILANLHKRFANAGLKQYHSAVVNLLDIEKGFLKKAQPYAIIICDAPCTGSGTWSRTPEQLYFFQADKIAAFASLQKKIAINAIEHLQAGGYFLYITCSVFKQENEDVVEVILQKNNCSLIMQQLIIGYEQKADTLFAALFKKSN
ncbi:MAG: hypothetical protein RL115_249 [Bacteroidota bacterium]